MKITLNLKMDSTMKTINHYRTTHKFQIMSTNAKHIKAILDWCEKKGYNLNCITHRNEDEPKYIYYVRVRIDKLYKEAIKEDYDLIMHPDGAWLIDLKLEIGYNDKIHVAETVEIR